MRLTIFRTVAILTTINLAATHLTAQSAPKPAPKPVSMGTVIVTVTPAAEVFVGTERIGEFTAQTLTLPVARHVLTFNHPDYQPLRRTIEVSAGKPLTLTIDLAEKAVLRRAPAVDPAARAASGSAVAAPSTNAPSTASVSSLREQSARPETTLLVRLEPKALLRIDGRVIGEISEHTEPVTPGRHIVLIEHPDYQPLQRIVSVKDGEAATLVLNLAEKGRRKK